MDKEVARAEHPNPKRKGKERGEEVKAKETQKSKGPQSRQPRK